MFKLVSFLILSLGTLSEDCTSYNPVCGTNGVTYRNACSCRKAKVDVGYTGVCNR